MEDLARVPQPDPPAGPPGTTNRVTANAAATSRTASILVCRSAARERLPPGAEGQLCPTAPRQSWDGHVHGAPEFVIKQREREDHPPPVVVASKRVVRACSVQHRAVWLVADDRG